MDRRRARILGVVVAGIVVLIDQATKAAIVASLALRERVAIVPGYFDLTYVTNPGGVWSVGAGMSPALRTAIFLAVPSAITLIAIWYSLSLPPKARWRQSAIALVVGGAIGNLLDRLFRNPPEVVDFLLAHWRDVKHWPAFNVADSAICVGVAILLVASFKDDADPDEAGEDHAAGAPNAAPPGP